MINIVVMSNEAIPVSLFINNVCLINQSLTWQGEMISALRATKQTAKSTVTLECNMITVYVHLMWQTQQADIYLTS